MRIEVIVLPFREFRVICVSYLSGLIAMNTLKTSNPDPAMGVLSGTQNLPGSAWIK